MRLLTHPVGGGTQTPRSPRPVKRAARPLPRGWTGLIALGALLLPGCGADIEGPTEVPEVQAATGLAMVSGNGQQGSVGAILTQALVVRVTDGRGEEIAGVEVVWGVVSGDGLVSFPGYGAVPAPVFVTRTRADGVAAVHVIPRTAGTITVAAEALGHRGSPVTFSAEAAPHEWPPVPASALVYERAAYAWTTFALGSSHERYVLYGDGVFGLQFDSPRWGFFEYSGAYSDRREDDEGIALSFDDDERWSAAGTFRDDCLEVEYSLIASLSGFEDGTYCQPSKSN